MTYATYDKIRTKIINRVFKKSYNMINKLFYNIITPFI